MFCHLYKEWWRRPFLTGNVLFAMRAKSNGLWLTVAIVIAIAISGCGSNGNERTPDAGSNSGSALPQGSEPVDLGAINFTTRIDNPYWPMQPGSKWVYRESGQGGKAQRVVVTVTGKTKVIAGVKARVVHDVVTEEGALVEDTYDWYAQDEAGNIWYLGEATKEYENGNVVSTEGSWQAGVDGAQAGIAVPANPKAGMSYRQEHYSGQAEDAAQILSIDEQVEVPFGHFREVLMTKDFTPLQPKVLEYKFYAKNVGPVMAISVSGGGGIEELVRYRAPK